MTNTTAPRVGFVLSHEQFPPPRLIEFATAAERSGFDELWTSDHFHPWQDNQGHAGQAWVTLSAVGQRTASVPFGTGVTCPTMRYRPTIVAQAFATLGLLYPGRVFLGVGAGEALNEVPAGAGWGSYRERAERLAEAIQLIRQLWTGEWVSHHGQYYAVDNARIYDLPPQPVPIYVAASGEHAARRAGELGDGWITDANTIKDERIRNAFYEGARSVGKDPHSMRVLVESFVVVGDEVEAEEAARFWRFVPIGFEQLIDEPDPRRIQHAAEEQLATKDVYSNWIVSDEARVHADALYELASHGATDVYVHSGQVDQQRVIQFYGGEVLPRLDRCATARAA